MEFGEPFCSKPECWSSVSVFLQILDAHLYRLEVYSFAFELTERM